MNENEIEPAGASRGEHIGLREAEIGTKRLPDIDVLEKKLRCHRPNDCIVDRRGLIALIQRLREAEKSKARYEFCVQHGYLILEALEVYTYDQAIADREIDTAIDQQRKIATGEDLNL